MACEYAVRVDMMGLDGWLNYRTLKRDLKCPDCKRLYAEIGEMISRIWVPDKPKQWHTCKDCALKHINKGAIDVLKKRQETQNMKQELIQKIMALKGHRYKTESTCIYNECWDLTKKDISKLEEIYEECVIEDSRLNLIEEDMLNYVETETEAYLIKDYNAVENKKYLRSPLQIEDYFKEYDDSSEYFECGQGYAQEEAELLVKIGNKFYNVKLHAGICSAKQDRGDRLYWVENIRKVEYAEVDKPLPKQRTQRTVILSEVSDEDMEGLMEYLRENNLKAKEV